MALQKVASCIAELNRRMKASAMFDVLLQDGVVSVPEYSQLNTTVDRSGEIAGNRSLTRLLLRKSEADLCVFLSHLRELHPDLAELLERSEEASRVCGQTETPEMKLAVFLASSLHVASSSSTDGERDVELQALRAERDAIAVDRDTIAADRDTIAADRDTVAADRDTIAAERHLISVERDALQTTVAEGTSAMYERAPVAVQQRVRNLFRLRHESTLMNHPRGLPTWRTVGNIPDDIETATACVFQGHMYLSVSRRRGSAVIVVLRNPLNDLNRPWTQIPLPPAPVGKTWERAAVFSSETALYCWVTTDYKSVPSTILEYRVGEWVLVTQLPSARRWARYAICDDSIVVAGGQNPDDTPCLEISMFPLRAEQSMRTWRQIGKLDTLRRNPFILSQGKRVHVVGGTGYFKDTATSIITLTPVPSSTQQPHSYSQSTSVVAAAPHRTVGAVMVHDSIVTAGGWPHHSAGSSTVERSDQCSMWESITSAWLSLPALSIKQHDPYLFFYDSLLYCLWGGKSDDGNVYDGIHSIDVLSV